LATALKGDKKMQGNWGERVLNDILKKSGLQEGISYE
jgi:DNA recombination protein RmuC